MGDLDVNLKPKSFWAKPEGTTGMLFALGGVTAGLYFLYHALPVIITMLQDTLHAVILAGILGAILYVAFDKRFRALAWFGYQSIMRAITSIFVTVDPIGIVENYIKSMKANLEKMNVQIGNLKGQMTNITRTVSANTQQAQNSLQLAEQAKKKSDEMGVALNTRAAARLQDSNKNLQELNGKLKVLYTFLGKMADNAQSVIEDTQSEVDVRKREYAAISAGTNAMRSAMSVLNGDPDKKAIFDMSMEHLADNISMQVGEMDNFMRLSQNIMSKVDLQNGVFEENGMKMLVDWEKNSGTLLLSADDKKNLLANVKGSSDDDAVPVKADNPYKGLLKKK